MDEITVIALVLAGLLVGAAAAALVALVRRGRLLEAHGALRGERDRLREAVDVASRDAVALRADRDEARQLAEDRARTMTRLETELSAKREQVEAQKALVEEARQGLGETFAALGAKALHANNEQFIALAKRSLETVLVEAKGDATQRQQAIENMVKPIRDLLEKQGTAVSELERRRESAYRGLEEQIKSITQAHQRLGAETSRLVTALRRSEHRGRWGEMQLRNAVELAGMTEHCDFEEQVTTTGESKYRPDMVVRLPGGGSIVVDAKVALDAYLDVIADPGERDAAATARARREALDRHAKQVETHARSLAKREYWAQFERSPKIVVMFMPLETALTAALEVRPDLHADAMKDHVLIATPTLLVALLRSVAYGWQQEDVAENARQIAATGRELYDRLAKYSASFERVGGAIERAAKTYNEAAASLESRLLPSARRLRKLHVTTESRIEEPKLLDAHVRPLTRGELLGGTEVEAAEADDG